MNRVSAMRTRMIDALEGAEQLDDVIRQDPKRGAKVRQTRSAPPALEWN